MAFQEKCNPAGPVKEIVLGEFEVASQPGNETEAMQRVIQVVTPLGLSGGMQDRVKTAVAECTMNAMEHGNDFQKEIPVRIRVSILEKQLQISVCDQGGEKMIPDADRPDLEAKLAGLQSPRGWGLFLIEHMVDEMRVQTEGIFHIVTLIFNLPGDTRLDQDPQTLAG